MQRTKEISAAMAAALCGTLLTGCASTMSSNSSVYMTQMSQKMNVWKNSIGAPAQADSSAASSSEEVDDGTARVATPANWTVNESGEYSFDGVEDAAYYIIYLYDKNDTSGSFAYMSTNIEDDGSAAYTGKLSDLFGYCYGLYDAEVVAYPEVGVTDVKKSKAAECDFTVTGEVPDASVGYLWDGFTNTFGVELLNFEEYAASSFPTEVKVTLTNQSDSADVVTLDIQNVSIDDNVFSAETQDVTLGATYAVQASMTWDSEVVTNASATLDLGTVTTAEGQNAMTDGYGYLNTDVYLSLDYPMVKTDFDLANGGSAGTWYFFVNAFTTNKGVAIPTTFVDCRNFQGEKSSMGGDYHDGEDVEFTVTPTAANSGAAYSYDLTVAGPRDVVSLFDGFFWNDMPDGTGTLDLYSDGTFKMVILPPQSNGDSAGPMGPRGLAGSSIEGNWTDNGDGTATLSYNHTTAALTE